jgi:tetratricopeptide (TPR) repeat protein
VIRIGRYDLGPLLGKGGQGRVYEAVLQGPAGFRKRVALKLLRSEALRREARIGGMLRHPNLVDVYEIGEQRGIWYCAMELCRSGSLARYAPLPPRAVVEVGCAVADALGYAHAELGLVHLDLKPANLLLDGPVVKVADLGIAQAAGFEVEGLSRGTAGYVAPERHSGGAADPRTDIWSLGIVLLELATGRRGAAATDVLGDLDAPTGEWPAWLAPVLARCLDPDPDARFPDMSALSAALRALDAPGECLADLVPPPPEAPIDDAQVLPDLIGRGAAGQALRELLVKPGVGAVTGPPGIGKTALVRAVTADLPHLWVDAEHAATEEALLRGVAAALHIEVGRGAAAWRAIRFALAARGAVDLAPDGNDLLEAPDAVLAALAADAPLASIAATTRTRPAPPAWHLELGPLDEAESAVLIRTHAAARGVEDIDEAALRELARRLDGLPLALELAAGRLGILSVAELVARLDLSVLRGGSAGRHGTLEAALDWSWGLLSAVERDALAQLAVFVGGFELATAEAVLDLPTGTAAIDVLMALQTRSLVSRGPRFALLAPVAAHATLRGGAQAAAEIRHGTAFAARGAPDAIDAMDGPRGPELRSAVGRDLENFRVACTRAVARGDVAVALPVFRAIAQWARISGVGPWFYEVVDPILALDPPPLARLDLLHAATNAAHVGGHLERGETWGRMAVADAAGIGDPFRVAASRAALGAVLRERGKVQDAEEMAVSALAVARAAGITRVIGPAATNLGLVCQEQGRMAEARALYGEALAAYRAVGNLRPQGLALGNLALVEQQEGRMEEARAAYQAALAVHRAAEDRRGEAVTSGNYAGLLLDLGQSEEAAVLLARVAAEQHGMGNIRSEGYARCNLGNALARLGRAEEAVRELTAARGCAECSGDRRLLGGTLGVLGGTLLGLGRHGEALAAATAGEEELRGTRDPYELARVLAVKAQVLARLSLPGAQEALAEAEGLVSGNTGPASQDVAVARAALGQTPTPGAARNTGA